MNITGRVIDSQKNIPIVGAIITIMQNDTIYGTVNTDFVGVYSIDVTTAGAYTVVAAATGYQTTSADATLNAAQTTTTVNLSMSVS